MFYHSNEASSLRTYISSFTKLLWFQHYSKSQMNKLFHSFHDLQQICICWGRKPLLTRLLPKSMLLGRWNLFGWRLCLCFESWGGWGMFGITCWQEVRLKRKFGSKGLLIVQKLSQIVPRLPPSFPKFSQSWPKFVLKHVFRHLNFFWGPCVARWIF